MQFKLEKTLAADTDSYERSVYEKYAEYREEKGKTVRVGNLVFDIEAMLLPYTCDTSLCIPKRGKNTCCCVKYTPRVSAGERRRIEEILPALERRFPGLAQRIQKSKGYYHWTEEYDRYLNKAPKEQCIFMDHDGGEIGFPGCLIHAWCLENGIPTHRHKPSACFMFPLFLLDMSDDDNTLFITAHTREVMGLGEEEDGGFCDPACLANNPKARNPLYVEMKDTLTVMFGAKLWPALDKKLRAIR